jgi:hypothetical protein
VASASAKTKAKLAETSPPTPPPAGETSPKSNFREEIDKSRAMIENADKAPETPLSKNKGGRPSKDEVRAREEALKAARIADLERVAPPASLKAMVALPFDLLALKTGFQGWRLTPGEAEAIVPSLHSVMVTYAPAFQNENVALLALAGAIASVGLGKFLSFLHAGQDGQNSPEAEAESQPAAASGSSPTEGGVLMPPGFHVP